MVVPQLQGNQLQTFNNCCECQSIRKSSKIKHCLRCECCHLGYDHYCQFLSICVDSFNYSHFLRFILAVEIITALALGTQIWLLFYFWDQSLQQYVLVSLNILITIETILVLGFCTYILCYHIFLIVSGVSTKQHFSKIRHPGNKSFWGCVTYSLEIEQLQSFIKNMPKIFNEQSIVRIEQDDLQENTLAQSKILAKE